MHHFMFDIQAVITRIFVLLSACLLASLPASSQTPNGSVPATKTARTLPTSYTAGAGVNSVRTWKPNQPLTTPSSVVSATDVKAVPQSTIYLDGLGRTLQTVSKGGSASATRDLVAPSLYDNLGREPFKYLPYSGTTGDGAFKLSPFADQKTFYDGILTTANNNKEEIYYGETQFEASPVGRVTKSMAPGNNWQGSQRGISQQYLMNAAADEVRIWNVTVTMSGNIPTAALASPGVYAAGELTKEVTTNENGKQVIVYKDREGKMILKKVQIAASPGVNHTGWLCTYYAYDDLGNLRFVMPPRAVERLSAASWVLSAEVRSNLCFVYEYDARKRMVVKKVPGADPVEMVYDLRDRLVLSRDGNLKAVGGKWMATIYDDQDRPSINGIYSSSLSHDALITAMESATGSVQVSTSIQALDHLSVARYETGTNIYKARVSVELQPGFETPSGGTTEMMTDPAMAAATESLTAS